MRPWIKRTLFGLFGASVALGGLTACGHRYGHQHFSGMGTQEHAQWRKRAVERVASHLDLNAEQKQRLNVVADKLHEQRVALRGASEPRAQALSLLATDKFDRSRAQALLSEKMAAVNSKSPEVIAAFGDFFDSLSPAQQAHVRDFLQHRRHGWGRRG